MKESKLTIDAPLRGEWFVETSPADRLPSHGTNRFGLRYAFDFIQVDWEKADRPTHNKKNFEYYIRGIPLDHYYCFGKPVYAPFAGEVVTIEDDTEDGKNASWLYDQVSAIRNSLFFDPKRDGFKSIAGNYIIIKKETKVYAVFCHLQNHSITVSLGEKVQKGQFVGNVGHTGNSTEPHLHFHLMDSNDLEKANGIPFVFKQYEIYNSHTWKKVNNEIPAAKERVRFLS